MQRAEKGREHKGCKEQWVCGGDRLSVLGRGFDHHRRVGDTPARRRQ